MRYQKEIGRALSGLAVLLGLIATAQAGSFSVNPVRVTLSAKEAVAAVTVRNESTEQTVVQLETFNWSQQQGKDSLEPTNEVLATPPILTIPPGASRIVRVGLRRPADPQRELTYRLTLREVPPPDPLPQALRVALLISMPIFVDPPRPAAADIHWRAARTKQGQIRLQAQNIGFAHTQLGKVEITRADGGAAIASRDMAEYVLPNNSREWLLTPVGSVTVGMTVHVVSLTDAGSVSADVKLDDASSGTTPTLATVSH
jgi:fimbrial chaperone protein